MPMGVSDKKNSEVSITVQHLLMLRFLPHAEVKRSLDVMRKNRGK